MISAALAPGPAERQRFLALRRATDDRLADTDRQRIHDRLHGFLMGFSQLRALEGGNAAMMVADFVEAVEDMPVEAVHRACKGWNQRKFDWPNYSYPPMPPDICRAVREVRVEMQVERYDLNQILIARPVEPASPVSEAKRAEITSEVAELLRSITDAGKARDAELAASAKADSRAEHLEHVRRFQAAEVERKAQIAKAQPPPAPTEGTETGR